MNKITFICKEELLSLLYENLSECSAPIEDGQEDYHKGWVSSLNEVIKMVEGL